MYYDFVEGILQHQEDEEPAGQFLQRQCDQGEDVPQPGDLRIYPEKAEQQQG